MTASIQGRHPKDFLLEHHSETMLLIHQRGWAGSDFSQRSAFGRLLPVAVIGSNVQFSDDHGYEARWSNPMQSLVGCNANDWSGRMQTGGHVECNSAPGR